jgi:hypothetical protein
MTPRWRVRARGESFLTGAEFTSFSKAKAWMRMFPADYDWEIARIPAKPPFDPLKAGWIPCPTCENHESSFEGSFFSYRCPGCDGLGIVVGPPSDGLRMVSRAGTPYWKDSIAGVVAANKLILG